MKIAQTVMQDISTDLSKLDSLMALEPQLVLVFGFTEHFANPSLHQALRAKFPHAQCVGCTTAGEIAPSGVVNHTTVVTAIHFENTQFTVATAPLESMEKSYDAGAALARQLQSDRLKAVLVLGQGVAINGSGMIEGMVSVLGASMPITGGLAGDDGAFVKTYTMSNQAVSTDHIIGIGFEGEKLMFSHGSFGGWKPFGPTRKVTRCVGNILYELDGEPALDVYKRYLGDYAKDLPGSGLLFPFEMLSDARESLGQIRTILGVNEADGSLVLAGVINPDGYLRLMHAHTNDLVDGAETAANSTIENVGSASGQALGLLVSCVGRKLVMGGRVDEEVEAVQDILGEHTVLCGFYSNGEICPGYKLEACSLHNQTMTITYLAEAA
ncbi:FIST N-terminal domain-containing protein [Undibacterium cyanobacteriorum]|uniref:FIST N-terminal domain-containing protein n=1 Tax=Undibacterium cyanobacteriorum TaxID=3073561 RepID=A0ABY9RLQ4_9BURK|nr:FIST N-terminal domain-containing protein [Undibacterium sp. 20NA77.5]WMW81615.1 FIST N-terminal domain-containing protein [Undibacterium sp. 20NA77.5]